MRTRKTARAYVNSNPHCQQCTKSLQLDKWFHKKPRLNA
ncbi:hypothetical protein ALP03_04991 [Pseudomonas amygdali pv. tabaci]|uniref:Uncharacterized protein n=1 Tax=Pseudomonas amygdali pv. tabaci TaxID=322 RepID=A0A3M6FS41_PSEAJ|nr:hypothetical protein ALP03_04991 [Pseudomonas amygdali pv. tabaci]